MPADARSITSEQGGLELEREVPNAARAPDTYIVIDPSDM